MGTFVPNVDAATSSTTTPTGYLPNGHYDIYNLGSMYDSTMLLGPATQTVKFGGMASQDTTSKTTIATSSVEQYMSDFAGMSMSSPSSFANLQMQLYAGGYYTGKPNFGSYSGDDAAAMKKAITSYLGIVNGQTGTPLDFGSFLDRSSEQGVANGNGLGGSSSRAPLQETATGTLDQYSDQAGQSELGRNTTAAEQASFASKYHGEEASAYNGGSEAAGAPDAEAKQFVDTTDQGEVQTHLQADYAERMLSMLGVQSS